MKNKKEPTKFSVLIDAIIFALISSILGFVLGMLAMFIMGFFSSTLNSELSIVLVVFDLLGIIGTILGGIYVINKIKKDHLLNINDRLSFNKINIKFLIGLAMSVISFTNLLNYFLIEVIKLKPQASPDLNISISGLITIFTIVIIAPIFEEICIRYGVIEKMESKYSKWVSIIVSSLLFCALHFYNIQGSIVVLFIAIIFALIYCHTRNLLYVMLLHFINNLGSVIQTLILKNNPESIFVTFPSTYIHIIILVVVMLLGAYLVYSEKDKVKYIKQILN